MCENFKKQGFSNFIIIDGEELRKKLKRQYGFSVEERFDVAKNIVDVALEEIYKGKLVVISTITHKVEMRKMARKQIDRFMEVYLNCPVNVCASRDYKDHYRRAFAGEYEMFVGVTDAYEESDSPEVVLHTNEMNADECSDILLQKALSMFKVE